MHRELDSDSVLDTAMGVLQRDFLRGELKQLRRDPIYSCISRKGTGLKVQFAPIKFSWAGRLESCTVKGFLGPSPTQLAIQGLYKMECSGLRLLRGQWAGN